MVFHAAFAIFVVLNLCSYSFYKHSTLHIRTNTFIIIQLHLTNSIRCKVEIVIRLNRNKIVLLTFYKKCPNVFGLMAPK